MSPANDGWESSTEVCPPRHLGMVAVTLAALLLGACAGGPKIGETIELAQAKSAERAPSSAVIQTELERAIEYWGKQHTKSPRDLKAALSYARNLKAAGQKDRAIAVLQAASIYHGADRELASEYGRLALDMGQTGLAQKLLEAADDPAKPDWRVISARGTVLAKQNNYKQAIPLYEHALRLSPGQPSVLNNLAMAHAASGEAPRAEGLLRQAAEKPDGGPKVRLNLALVLGLQGKYDEARNVSAQDIPAENAVADVDYVRQMVRLAPQDAAPAVLAGAKSPAAKPAQMPVALPLRGGTIDAAAQGSTGVWATQVADVNSAVGKPPVH